MTTESLEMFDPTVPVAAWSLDRIEPDATDFGHCDGLFSLSPRRHWRLIEIHLHVRSHRLPELLFGGGVCELFAALSIDLHHGLGVLQHAVPTKKNEVSGRQHGG